MKQLSLCIAFLLFSSSVVGQTISGRSKAGLIVPSYADGGINGSGTGASGLAFEFEFTEPSGNKYLDARETGRLRIVIANTGRLPARGVVARVVPLASPSSITYNDSILVGEIPAGSTRYAIFYFSAKYDVPSQILTFQIELHDHSGLLVEPQLLTFLTRSREYRRPEN